jgi:hypothetical protein
VSGFGENPDAIGTGLSVRLAKGQQQFIVEIQIRESKHSLDGWTKGH